MLFINQYPIIHTRLSLSAASVKNGNRYFEERVRKREIKGIAMKVALAKFAAYK